MRIIIIRSELLIHYEPNNSQRFYFRNNFWRFYIRPNHTYTVSLWVIRSVNVSSTKETLRAHWSTFLRMSYKFPSWLRAVKYRDFNVVKTTSARRWGVTLKSHARRRRKWHSRRTAFRNTLSCLKSDFRDYLLEWEVFRRDRWSVERFVYRKLLKQAARGAALEQLPVVADEAADHISGNRRKGSSPAKLRSYR